MACLFADSNGLPLPEANVRINERKGQDGLRERTATIIAEIEAAFDSVSRDGGVSLHQADAIDDYASGTEQEEARKIDRDSRWQDVPDDQIAAHCDALSFLDAIGFRYYIPAFMVWMLKDPARMDLNTSASTVFALTQPVCKNPADEKYKKYSQFTDQQRSAIGHFLEHLCELGFEDPDSRPMKRSLRYWLQEGA